MISPNSNSVYDELKFKATTSSGPGGQHVNKVNTRIELKWDIQSSKVLNEEQRTLLLVKLSSKISNDGVLLISEQQSRSQLQNKMAVLQKLDRLLQTAFAKVKRRKATKPTYSSVKKRLDSKKKLSEKKKWRKGL